MKMKHGIMILGFLAFVAYAALPDDGTGPCVPGTVRRERSSKSCRASSEKVL